MIEKFGSEEIIEETPRPNLLDIVKINGRWAQVGGRKDVVKYLDDLSAEIIDWNDYQAIQLFGAPEYPSHVGGLIVKKIAIFTDTEMQNIRWGAEDKGRPELKLQVKVFGEFEKK